MTERTLFLVHHLSQTSQEVKVLTSVTVKQNFMKLSRRYLKYGFALIILNDELSLVYYILGYQPIIVGHVVN